MHKKSQNPINYNLKKQKYIGDVLFHSKHNKTNYKKQKPPIIYFDH